MTTHDMVLLAIGAAFAAVSFFVVPKLRTWLFGLPADRRALIFQLSHLAFGFVEELVRKSATDLDDKAAAELKKLLAELELEGKPAVGLAKVNELLKATGTKVLSAGEEKLVLAQFDTMHASSAASPQ